MKYIILLLIIPLLLFAQITIDSDGHYLIPDQTGYKNVMSKIDKFWWNPDSGFDCSHINANIHPAFIVNGTIYDEIYIGSYEAVLYDPAGDSLLWDTNPASSSDPNVAGSAHSYIAQSIAGQDARVKIDFDAARRACQNMNGNGIAGWHLLSNAEWAAIALWCQAHQMPLGNNSYGDDADDPTVIGTMAPGNNMGGPNPSRWLGGSGGLKTSHNRSLNGIYDLNGNVWEWIDGFKLVDGKIYVVGDLHSSPAKAGNSFEATEANWRDTGMYFRMDATGDLYLSALGRGTADYRNLQFDDITGANDELKKLAIGPVSTGGNTHGADHTYIDNAGERIPLRGGNWDAGSRAGVFVLYLSSARSNRYWNIGFRPAFVNIGGMRVQTAANQRNSYNSYNRHDAYQGY